MVEEVPEAVEEVEVVQPVVLSEEGLQDHAVLPDGFH
jgi:hypothetical protein